MGLLSMTTLCARRLTFCARDMPATQLRRGGLEGDFGPEHVAHLRLHLRGLPPGTRGRVARAGRAFRGNVEVLQVQATWAFPREGSTRGGGDASLGLAAALSGRFGAWASHHCRTIPDIPRHKAIC